MPLTHKLGLAERLKLAQQKQIRPLYNLRNFTLGSSIMCRLVQLTEGVGIERFYEDDTVEILQNEQIYIRFVERLTEVPTNSLPANKNDLFLSNLMPLNIVTDFEKEIPVGSYLIVPFYSQFKGEINRLQIYRILHKVTEYTATNIEWRSKYEIGAQNDYLSDDDTKKLIEQFFNV